MSTVNTPPLPSVMPFTPVSLIAHFLHSVFYYFFFLTPSILQMSIIHLFSSAWISFSWAVSPIPMSSVAQISDCPWATSGFPLGQDPGIKQDWWFSIFTCNHELFLGTWGVCRIPWIRFSKASLCSLSKTLIFSQTSPTHCISCFG